MCRAILRYLAHPKRLRENSLARSIWKCARLDPETSDRSDLTKCLIASFVPALAGLSPFQRVIVERRFSGGDVNAEIAADLHVSLRHVYRERALALRAIALYFESGDLASQTPTVRVAPDSLSVRLRLARTLEQNGQWVTAAEILERLCAEVADPEKRCTLESRLARLYTDIGRYGLADQHIRSAQINAENAKSAVAKAEATLGEARLLFATGNLRDAQDAARRGHIDLRAQSVTGDNSDFGKTLLGAINLRTEILIGQWSSGDAVTLAAESRDVLQRFQINDIAPIIETRFWQAAAQFISGRPDGQHHAESELWGCYELAIEHSQMKEAIDIAVLLASVLRSTSRSQQAIALLSPLADVVGTVGVGDYVAGFYLELGFSALNAGPISLAAECHNNLRNLTFISPHSQAVTEIFAARVAFAGGRFDASLKHAESAETALAKVGRAAWIGPALRLQAESLARLGKTARAIRTMSLAVENFQMTNQIRPLIGAYLTMASLTGDPKFRAKANNLRARLP